MLLFHLLSSLVASSSANVGIQANARGQYYLMNSNLKVAAVPWNPYVIFYCNEREVGYYDECVDKSKTTYGGPLLDLLKLLTHARNVTFTVIKPPTYEWGICNGRSNCTGMIGMVNRGEVDFALGRKTHIRWTLFQN